MKNANAAEPNDEAAQLRQTIAELQSEVSEWKRIYEADGKIKQALENDLTTTAAQLKEAQRAGYVLAMICLQSNRYVEEGGEFASAVDAILALQSKPAPTPTKDYERDGLP